MKDPPYLCEVKATPDPYLVEQIRETLRDIESGEIVGISYFASRHGGGSETFQGGNWSLKDALFCFEKWRARMFERDRD